VREAACALVHVGVHEPLSRVGGKALAPAMTLNRMYHWVPSTISGLNQIFGLSCNETMATTTMGNSTFAGNAAFRPPFRDDFARHSGMISPGVTGQH
jgi:hypothetical protein